ncbi:HotDog domain-containing protein [Trametes polyzona]|nr:HotDog domain-containing protein [Trametes polyzona]
MGTPDGEEQSLDAKVAAVRFGGSTELSPKQREAIVKFADVILRGRGQFAKPTGSRLQMTEVTVYEREEDGKTQVRMVFEIDVGEDMLNSGNMMHGGCSMFLIDVCSSIALVALGIVTSRNSYLVSQAITTVFHAPATTGARLSIVNNTVSFGARTVTARTEIWDTTNRRLVATGVHNQMQPSAPKL